MLDAGSSSIVAQKVVTSFFFTWKILYCLWELMFFHFISDPECMKDPVPVPQGTDRIRIHNTDQNWNRRTVLLSPTNYNFSTGKQNPKSDFWILTRGLCVNWPVGYSWTDPLVMGELTRGLWVNWPVGYGWTYPWVMGELTLGLWVNWPVGYVWTDPWVMGELTRGLWVNWPVGYGWTDPWVMGELTRGLWVNWPAEEGSARGADLTAVVAVLPSPLTAHLAQQALTRLPKIIYFLLPTTQENRLSILNSDPRPGRGSVFLWTGAALYAPYRLLLIPNKFWMCECDRGVGWQCGKNLPPPSPRNLSARIKNLTHGAV